MDTNTQNNSLRQPLNQLPPVPKLFKPLTKTGDISIALKNSPRGPLSFHSSVKASQYESVNAPQTTNPVKKLTAFRFYQAKQKRASTSRSFTQEVENIFNSIKGMFSGLVLVFLAGLKLLALLIFRAFHEIIKGMLRPFLFILSKVTCSFATSRLFISF